MEFLTTVFTATLCLVALPYASSLQLPDIYWNSSNPIFNSVIKPHEISVWMKDRLDIHCPYYQPGVRNADFVEYSAIYQVSEWGYENCVLDDTARVLITCQTPFRPTHPLSITFREWTPNPGAPEFEPGRIYYFLTTSGGAVDSIRQSAGGLCSAHGMRMKVEVNGYRPRKTKVNPTRQHNIATSPPATASPAPPSPKFHRPQPQAESSQLPFGYQTFEVVDPPVPGIKLTPPNHIQKGRYDYLSDQPANNKYHEISYQRNNNNDHEISYDHNNMIPRRIIATAHSNPVTYDQMSRSRIFGGLGRDFFARTRQAQPLHADGLDQIEVLVEYAAEPHNLATSSIPTSTLSCLTILLFATLTVLR